MNAKRKVLIVEDDAIIATDLVTSLSAAGYDVIGPIARGEEVLEQAASLKADIILMDIHLLGDLDGIQTAEAIQDVLLAPVVFLTGLSDEDTLRRARLAKPFGYLLKPFDIIELKANLEITLDRYHLEQIAALDESMPTYMNIKSGAEGDSWSTLKMGATTEEIVDFLSRIKLFADISRETIAHFAATCSINQVSSGELLFIEGDPCTFGFIPISGRINITKSSINGKELIVCLLGPGDLLSLTCLPDSSTVSFSAKSQIDSKVLRVSKDAWVDLLKQAPHIYPHLVSILSNRLNAAYTLSSSIAHSRVEDRIVHTIIALLQEFGKPSQNGINEGRIFMTRKELAELTGTTPETSIRITKNIERDGILDLSRPGIIKIPNIEKLKQYLKTL